MNSDLDHGGFSAFAPTDQRTAGRLGTGARRLTKPTDGFRDRNSFAGYSWSLKGSTEPVGPGPNVFSDWGDNVWVDSAGQLHLRTTYRDGQWHSAEVILNQSLGYGKYTFNVASPLGNLDPNVVVGLFTWNDDAAHNHREIDVEFARWGNATDPTNAQHVVQPYDHAGNLRRFVQPLSGPSVHCFTWAPKSVTFTATSAAGEIANWRYTTRDVPRHGGERVHINLWLNGGTPPLNGAETEVAVSGFTFTRVASMTETPAA